MVNLTCQCFGGTRALVQTQNVDVLLRVERVEDYSDGRALGHSVCEIIFYNTRNIFKIWAFIFRMLEKLWWIYYTYISYLLKFVKTKTEVIQVIEYFLRNQI